MVFATNFSWWKETDSLLPLPDYQNQALVKSKTGENMKIAIAFLLLTCLSFASHAQAQSERQQFIRAEASEIALMHVRVIDGTGAPPLEDQTILISEGQIKKVGPTSAIKMSEEAKKLDLTG